MPLYTCTIAHFRNSYRKIIQNNNVDGRVLSSMKTKEDWRELGIVNPEDLRIIVSNPVARSLIPQPNVDSAPVPSDSNSTGKVAKYKIKKDPLTLTQAELSSISTDWTK